jgi:hypothetical protein
MLDRSNRCFQRCAATQALVRKHAEKQARAI